MLKSSKQLRRKFYARPAVKVAPDLLNKILVVGDLSGRIVETEAYGGHDDPGSHGHRGITPRNEVMFAKPGLLYVYFTYGMHWCACPVTGAANQSSAVLIRAVEPITGLPTMRRRRQKARNDRELCNGPAKLTQAFGMNAKSNGIDLVTQQAIAIYDDGSPPPSDPGVTTRIGLTKGTDLPWRFVVDSSVFLSRKFE